MELRIRPKSDFLLKAGWEELYVLTEYWENDMEYYTDELRFLRNLVGKYLIWLLKDENIDKARSIYNRIKETEEEKEKIHEKIKKHLHHLTELIQDSDMKDEERFRNDHIELEEKVADLAKKFRSIKQEVFSITEHIMESEKLQHLLNP